jgi:hypothetical protein
MEETKEAAMQWIESGKPVVYRCGCGWKGARAHYVTKEWALAHIKPYTFGKNFWILSWIQFEGQTALEMNELSESDMM